MKVAVAKDTTRVNVEVRNPIGSKRVSRVLRTVETTDDEKSVTINLRVAIGLQLFWI